MRLRMVEIMLQKEQFDNLKINELLNSPYVEKYAYINHDKCKKENGEKVHNHYHIFLKFKDPKNINEISNKFNIPMNCFEKIKGQWANCIQYLTHKNVASKYQYAIEDIKANYDFAADYEKQTTQNALKAICEQVAKGEILPYQYSTKIDLDVRIKHQEKINNSHKIFLEDFSLKNKRHIKVVWIHGETGTGKSYLAKWYARRLGEESCLSSSSNDPMQDYKCQPILILDDLRDSDFKYNDLLKILDPFHSSSMKSRFSNKHFVGHTIIVTSSVPLNEWYNGVQERNKHDSIRQLFRRIDEYIEMTEDEILITDTISLGLGCVLKGNTFKRKNPLKDETENYTNENKTYSVLNILDDEDLPF